MKKGQGISLTEKIRLGRIARIATLLLLALLFILPIIFRVLELDQESYYLNVLILCMMWASIVLSWNLVSGYLGMFTLAHQVFFGIGAYASALVALNFNISPWLGLIIGGIAAGLIGVLVAIPCLKLRAAPYIIIATMALAEIARLVTTNCVSVTRGELGLWEIAPFDNVGPILFAGVDRVPYYYLMMALFLLVAVICRKVINSPLGMAMEAIRESQDAAEALGVNITKIKIQVFIISAVMAGVIGSFYAHYIKILTPTSMFGIDVMTQIIAMNLLGGTGTLAGPVLGSFFITIIMEWLRFLADYRMLIYGALIVFIMIFLPGGIVSSLKPYIVRLILVRDRK